MRGDSLGTRDLALEHWSTPRGKTEKDLRGQRLLPGLYLAAAPGWSREQVGSLGIATMQGGRIRLGA